MVEVRAELVRVNGRFAAFKFLDLTIEDAEQVEAKLYRLDTEAEAREFPQLVH
jgi:hypothetical protein